MTMNGTWGYSNWDDKWKSTETLIHNLVDIASKGGNYLLNVGPKDDGSFPQESIDRLQQIGKWMKTNGEAIYATKASPLEPLAWGRCTRKESNGNTTLYISVFDWPADGKLFIPGISNTLTSIKLLAGGDVKAKQENGGLQIKLPEKAPDPIATVIKLELKGTIATNTVGVK